MHWKDLRSVFREAIEVGFLNARYLVDPVAERITVMEPDPSRVLTESFQILLIRYLVSGGGGQRTDGGRHPDHPRPAGPRTRVPRRPNGLRRGRPGHPRRAERTPRRFGRTCRRRDARHGRASGGEH